MVVGEISGWRWRRRGKKKASDWEKEQCERIIEERELKIFRTKDCSTFDACDVEWKIKNKVRIELKKRKWMAWEGKLGQASLLLWWKCVGIPDLTLDWKMRKVFWKKVIQTSPFSCPKSYIWSHQELCLTWKRLDFFFKLREQGKSRQLRQVCIYSRGNEKQNLNWPVGQTEGINVKAMPVFDGWVVNLFLEERACHISRTCEFL